MASPRLLSLLMKPHIAAPSQTNGKKKKTCELKAFFENFAGNSALAEEVGGENPSCRRAGAGL